MTKFDHNYRKMIRERNGRVRKMMDIPEQSWDDLKTHVDRLNKKGGKWTMWGAIQEGMRLFIKNHK